MAKKFGKFLLATAAVGATLAAAYYYMQKKDGVTVTPEEEDYDDLDDDLEEDCGCNLNYVPLTPEPEDEETILDDIEEGIEDAVEAIGDKIEKTVESVIPEKAAAPAEEKPAFVPLSGQLENVNELVEETIEDVENFFDEEL